MTAKKSAAAPAAEVVATPRKPRKPRPKKAAAKRQHPSAQPGAVVLDGVEHDQLEYMTIKGVAVCRDDCRCKGGSS